MSKLVAVRRRYVLYDDYITNRVAGAVDGTAAEPGPGTRLVTDVESGVYLSDGRAYFAPLAVPIDGEPALRYNTPIGRAAGRILGWTAKPTVNTGEEFRIGWSSSLSGAASNAFRFMPAALRINVVSGAESLSTDSYTADAQNISIVLRKIGAFFFRKLGGDWILIYPGETDTEGTLFPVVTNYSANFIASGLKIPSGLWLPEPLVSDGFGAAGTTDGLGHREGIVGGLGAGGDGLTWTNRLGTFGVSGGAGKFSALTGGVGLATLAPGVEDVFASVAITRSGGNAGLILRYVDASNYIYAYLTHDGSNAKVVMRKVIGGIDSEVQAPVTVTYVGGARLMFTGNYQKFRVNYNNATSGSEMSIIDAATLNDGDVGLYTTDAANTFDDFQVWAKGNEGQYAALHNYLPVTTLGLFAVGDSKTGGDDWVQLLIDGITAATGDTYEERPLRYGIGGYDTVQMAAYLLPRLPLEPHTASVVTINLGTNDAARAITESAWKAAMISIIDCIHAKWPLAQIFMAQPWRRSYPTYMDTLAGWVADMIALYPTFVRLGPDERVWVENGDDGATMTYDGIHYTEIAQPICAAEWLTAMGL